MYLLYLLHLPVILLHRWDNHTSAIPACVYLCFCSRDGAATTEARRKEVHPDIPAVPTCGFALQVGQPATDARRKVMHPTIPAELTCAYINFHRWDSQLLMQEGR